LHGSDAGRRKKMLYRIAGQYKTSYVADQSLFPIRQDAVLLGIILAVSYTHLRAHET